MLKQIIEGGRQHDATLHGSAKITHLLDLLDLLRGNAAPPQAVELPTLDEWVEAEGMDPDGW